MMISAALLTLAATPQALPCLSPFQRVRPLSAGAPGYQIVSIEVDGDVALSVGAGLSPLLGHMVHVDAYERDTVTGTWQAVQSLDFRGQSPIVPGVFELEGGRAILPLDVPPRQAVMVLERDPFTGLWSLEEIIPTFSRHIQGARLSGDRVAIGFEHPEVIEVWVRTSAGWVLEDSMTDAGPWSNDFSSDFDIEGDRIVVGGAVRQEVYRRTTSGRWEHERGVRPPTGFHFWGWSNPPVFADGRWITLVQENGTGSPDLAMSSLRVSPDAGTTRVIADGLLSSAVVPGTVTQAVYGAMAGGTMLILLGSAGCPNGDWAFAAVSTGNADTPELRGWTCSPGGGGMSERTGGIGYDGHTFAVTTVEYVGTAVISSASFATLLGSDHDRDGNCVRDAEQIAQQPDLDRNVNGRLDSSEARGSASCVPTSPNSTGGIALLRIVGTEFAPITDLTAVIEGVPANTIGVLAVARTRLAGPPAGPFSLCIGDGMSGAFARYPVVQSDAQGVAIVALGSIMLPGAVHVPGDQWGWQYVYRDGSGFGTSEAVRVVLQ